MFKNDEFYYQKYLKYKEKYKKLINRNSGGSASDITNLYDKLENSIKKNKPETIYYLGNYDEDDNILTVEPLVLGTFNTNTIHALNQLEFTNKQIKYAYLVNDNKWVQILTNNTHKVITLPEGKFSVKTIRGTFMPLTEFNDAIEQYISSKAPKPVSSKFLEFKAKEHAEKLAAAAKKEQEALAAEKEKEALVAKKEEEATQAAIDAAKKYEEKLQAVAQKEKKPIKPLQPQQPGKFVGIGIRKSLGSH